MTEKRKSPKAKKTGEIFGFVKLPPESKGPGKKKAPRITYPTRPERIILCNRLQETEEITPRDANAPYPVMEEVILLPPGR